MTDGIINIDTEPAKRLEFTSDKFNPASYLWKTGDTIVISFIMAKGSVFPTDKKHNRQGLLF
jgi:hypothetical protein